MENIQEGGDFAAMVEELLDAVCPEEWVEKASAGPWSALKVMNDRFVAIECPYRGTRVGVVGTSLVLTRSQFLRAFEKRYGDRAPFEWAKGWMTHPDRRQCTDAEFAAGSWYRD